MLNVAGIIMFCVGLLGLIISIALAFGWKIFDLMDELSGRKAKRQIKHLRELNVGLGGSSSLDTNELYEIIHNSGNLVWNSVNSDPRIDFGNQGSVVAEGKRQANTGNTATEVVEEDNIPNGLVVEVLEEQSSLSDI